MQPKVKELTLRGLVLGALITTVFTAANVYIGLKVGLTFASSIPAAVSETPDGRIRLDFVNNRPDSLDVYIKGRKRPDRR